MASSEQIEQDVSYLINSRIRGWMNGLERRELARMSADPHLRDAARILDERDQRAEGTVRPLGVVESGEKRTTGAESQHHRSAPADEFKTGGAGESSLSSSTDTNSGSTAGQSPSVDGSSAAIAGPSLVGSGEGASIISNSGAAASFYPAATVPQPRTPASVFQKQFDRLTTTVAAALNPD